MHLVELRIDQWRNIASARLQLAPGLNLITGGNGAGKTSILEAAYVLSHGESFRTHQADHLQRRNAAALTLFAHVETPAGSRRLGMSREANRWSVRVDGNGAAKLAELFVACPVVCFEPGSHALISGGADGRRGFLDWGVFHVEHDFAPAMRRYRRALRQRNALLKQAASDSELEIWDSELSAAADPVAAGRDRYLARFEPAIQALLDTYLPELGHPRLRFRPGWDRSMPLAQALAEVRDRDRLLGHTTRGLHRADWSIAFDNAPSAEHLSRGQEKVCAIVCMLAQVQAYRAARGDNPIIAFDDLCSELDASHQRSALAAVLDSGAQILLTGTEIPPRLLEQFPPQRRFHVEQGQVAEVV